MAGVKGRSGGARPGAGRKPAKPKHRRAKALETEDPDAFLKAVMKDSRSDFKDRMAAALALKKSGQGGAGMTIGKKGQQQAAAEAITQRNLTPLPPPSQPRRPRLVSVK